DINKVFFTINNFSFTLPFTIDMPTKEAFKFTGKDAEYYDQLHGPILFEPYGRYLASQIDISGVESALEIAAGTGRVTRQIRKVLPPSVRFVATDISNDMLSIARHELNNNGINFKVEDAQNLSFPDNSFDLVICQFGMMFLPDRNKGFSEIYRVLKPGGKFMCFTWDDTRNTPFSMYEPESLQKYCGDAGFKDVQVVHVSLKSGSATPDNLVNAFLRKHMLGKEVSAKDPALLEPLAQKMEHETGRKFGQTKIELDLSALLTTSVK